MKRICSVFVILLVVAFVMSTMAGCSFGGNSGNSGSTMTMSESAVSLSVGSSVSLSVTGASGALTWTSSDNNIATVENGTVTAKSAGSAVIKATDDNGKACTCNVTVSDKQITKLALDHQTASVEVGKTIQLSVTYTPTDASNAGLTWSSSNESVAVVNSEGYVTGVSSGVAKIACKAPNGVEASCNVTVKDSAAASSAAPVSSSKSADDTPRQPQNNGGHYGHFNPGYTYNAADFVFPDSSIRKLTRSEISSVLNNMTGVPVSGSFAQDAINEIYARNGYCFRDEGIRNYYEAQPWYYADESFSTSDFNDIENYNINLLLEYA